jgi:hypothetical protein
MEKKGKVYEKLIFSEYMKSSKIFLSKSNEVDQFEHFHQANEKLYQKK